MSFNPNRYEYPYGIHLLDDIHNLFPEIMYDAGMFPGNQLLAFLQMRTAELFPEEFSHSRAQYRLYQLERRRREVGIPQTPRRPQPMRVPQARRLRQQQPQPATVATAAATAAAIPFQTYTIPLTQLFTGTEEGDVGTGNNILNALLATVFLGNQGLTDLLTPVAVAPTPQQLAAATIVSSLEPPADVTCAICQDHAQTDATGWRIIRHCGHRFHCSCIDEWFRQNVHCPVCRHDIRDIPNIN